VSQALNGATNANDFGDYTGLAFFGGKMHPAWADNSTALAGNPDGAMEVATSTIAIASDTPPVGGPMAKLIAKPISKSGSYKFQIVFTDFTSDINPATLDNSDTLVTGPNGFRIVGAICERETDRRPGRLPRRTR